MKRKESTLKTEYRTLTTEDRNIAFWLYELSNAKGKRSVPTPAIEAGQNESV